MSDHHMILEMRDITKVFPGVKALDNVNIRVRSGEIHAICGENGAGKSTLMKVLSGIYPHGTYDGQIFFEGEEVEFSNIRASEGAGIAIIHQELALIPELSITENLFLGNEMKSGALIDWYAARQQARELMARVGLSDSPETAIKNIGVGKQQLVEIAKALAKNVKLLILDEPTSALNEDDSAHLLDLLRGLKAKGITSIMISHKLNEIEEVADSITIIRDGQTVESLSVSEGTIDQDRIIRAMVGRTMESRYPDRTPRIGETFFEVRDWEVEHPLVPGRLVCKNSSFHVRRGEVVGFAGLMGAGRTELARSIFGRSYGNWLGGTIRMNGEEIELRSVSAAIRHNLAYVSEDRKMLGLNLLDSVKNTISSAGLHRISKRTVIDQNAEFTKAEGYRKSMRIKVDSVHRNINTLSGGNQQKAVLAKWMFTQPELLILDEPTRGIDVGAKYEIYSLINEMADQGKGVIVISSELPEILGICDRIYTISEGAITGEVNAAETDQEALMRLMTLEVESSLI